MWDLVAKLSKTCNTCVPFFFFFSEETTGGGVALNKGVNHEKGWHRSRYPKRTNAGERWREFPGWWQRENREAGQEKLAQEVWGSQMGSP